MITMTTIRIFIVSLILSLLSSCAPKTFQLTDGTMITQKKADRIIKKCLRKAWRQMPKEDRKILNDIPVYMEIDTTGN